jgi:hypothetical protein
LPKITSGMLENLEPVTMLETSWNDGMSSKELRVTIMVLLKDKCVSPLPAEGTFGHFVCNATIGSWSAGGRRTRVNLDVENDGRKSWSTHFVLFCALEGFVNSRCTVRSQLSLTNF